MKKIAFFFLISLSILNFSHGQSFETTKNLDKQSGFFSFYYHEYEDRIFLEVDKLNTEFIYIYSLSSGIGSNDLGLDRGKLGQTQIVYFQKSGNKLLLIQPNMDFRASSDNPLEKLSVEQAFAKSVLFGFPILESQKNAHLIDITDFLIQDTFGVINTLKEADQGNYELDPSKSALEMTRTKAFPKNVEFEALLTFSGKAKGGYIKSVTPNPNLVSVVEHHSFIELPDNNYEPRAFDPRCGSFSLSYMDYSAPVEESIVKRVIGRHRLKKKNPNAAISEAIEPIVYYLDNGTPEPIRSALLDGAAWWNEAFESIGYKDAFQIRILPHDADPMDVRYNVIQWVHRSTRGWSYGNGVVDPRTGEIIKGHVSLGSLRIRQDFLIAQALMNKPFANQDDNNQAMLELALARIRQLSAHEVGHTLGFSHNFASSANNRASVMDYPHPKLSLKNGEVDFSNAYDTGMGKWDKVTVAYSYAEFDENKNERVELNKILTQAQDDGLRYISDNDARSASGSHAYAHLWDNGIDASSELDNLLSIRKAAIANFSEDNIRSNEPYSILEDLFVPLYFLHRYQTEAVAKLIGGMDYNYAVKGDGQIISEPVEVTTQKQALSTILKTLSPEVLAIPENKLALFPPRAIAYGRTRESFKGRTGVSFDALSAASTASNITLRFIFHPQRASRLIQQKSLDPGQIGLIDVIDEIVSTTFKLSVSSKPYLQEVQNLIQFNIINHMIHLAKSHKTLPQVNAIVKFKLDEIKELLSQKTSENSENLIFNKYLIGQIEKMKSIPLSSIPKIPDGSPIGSGYCNVGGGSN
ncbi:MAG: zinc-dependent metalloprotease [Cyclobacteriaceae bacterium]